MGGGDSGEEPKKSVNILYKDAWLLYSILVISKIYNYGKSIQAKFQRHNLKKGPDTRQSCL
jgi:hypothetical protein